MTIFMRRRHRPRTDTRSLDRKSFVASGNTRPAVVFFKQFARVRVCVMVAVVLLGHTPDLHIALQFCLDVEGGI
jgi:hypothetical protein